MVFVAQVEVDRIDADRPRGDQHSLEKLVRVALEVHAVLETSRSPSSMFTAISRGAGSLRTMAPTRWRRESPQLARPRSPDVSISFFNDLDVALADEALPQQPVAAAAAYPPSVRYGACWRVCSPGCRRLDRVDAGMGDRGPRTTAAGACSAAPDVRRGRRRQHALADTAIDRAATVRRPSRQPGHRRRARSARRARRGCRRAAGGDVEVVIEARDFMHLGQRQLHQLRQRREMASASST